MGITFIGPSENSMFLLGDKIASTIIAQSAGVPCVSWSGAGVSVTPDADGRVTVSDELFAQACVTTAEEAVLVAEKVGYPIMIKASEGGGGKGVRKAKCKEDINLMYRQVADEVKGSPIFLMRLCTGARHIEVQVLSDKHRNVSILSGRDCSMQRRFQKIVEEGPPIAVQPETMRQMELAAARLSLMVDYTHAGTVEYLFIQETGEFYFLELNPRLQVEHPVTEGITGVNLPSLQLCVAMGIDLTALPHMQKYVVDVRDPSPANPFEKVSGHTVAVRITAENAADGWKPTVGTISEVSFQSLPSVWGYFSVKTPAAEVHAFADSQFGHIFAHGRTRKAAARLLQLALKRLHVVGEICTNVPYVAELIRTEDFLENRVDTAWLDKLIEARMQLQPPDVSHVAICGSLLKAHLAMNEAKAKLLKENIERNACPTPEQLQTLIELRVEFIWNQTKFEFDVYRHSAEIFTVSANGSLVQAKLQLMPGGAFACIFGGKSHAFHYEEEPGSKLRLTIDGAVVTLEPENDPSLLVAPYGGKITRLLVGDGERLNKGEPYAEVEVMKMLFMLHASEAGVISLSKAPGAVVNAGEVIARLTLDDPALVSKVNVYEGELGDFEPPAEMGNDGSLHVQLRYYEARVHQMLLGFVDNEDKVLEQLVELLLNPAVLQSEYDELMTGAGSKLPQAPRERLVALQGSPDESFGSRVLAVLDEFVMSADQTTANSFREQAAPLYAFADRYKGGILDNSTHIVRGFIDHFLAIEKFYPDDRSELLGVYNLNNAQEDKTKVLQAVLSHSQLERKVSVLLQVLDFLGVYTHMDAGVLDALKELAGLANRRHQRVQRKAKQILANNQNKVAEMNKDILMPVLKKLSLGKFKDDEETAMLGALMLELALSEPRVLELLGSADKGMRKAVAKAAVLLWYSRFGARDISVKTYLRKGKEKLAVSWSYTGTDGRTLEGVLLVFTTMDDLEANFDDLASHTLSEQTKRRNEPTSAAVGVPVSSRDAYIQARKSLSEGRVQQASPAMAYEGRTTMHILILGESKEARDVRGKTVHKLMRNSFAYALVDEASTSRSYQRVIASKIRTLQSEGVAQVCVMLPDSMAVSTFNFGGPSFEENKLLRHILPAHSDWLELSRLDNFEVERCWFPDAPHTHVYHATAKAQKLDTRFFVRSLVLRKPALTEDEGSAAILQLAEHATGELTIALNTLEQAIGDSRYKKTESNHLFFRCLAPLCLSVAALERVVESILKAELTKITKMQARCAHVLHATRVAALHSPCHRPPCRARHHARTSSSRLRVGPDDKSPARPWSRGSTWVRGMPRHSTASRPCRRPSLRWRYRCGCRGRRPSRRLVCASAAASRRLSRSRCTLRRKWLAARSRQAFHLRRSAVRPTAATDS